MSKIEILQFIRDERGSKHAVFDFKVTYSEEKYEIYRNWALFIKENKKWVNPPKVKREIKKEDGTVTEEWVCVYERKPSLSKEIVSRLLSMLDNDFL